MGIGLIGILAAVVVVVVGTLIFFATTYQRCGANEFLIKSGKLFGSKTKVEGEAGTDFVEIVHGGGTFVIPLLQKIDKLPTRPFSINIPLDGALSQKNIRVSVPSSFTIRISTKNKAIMQNAAKSLVGANLEGIKKQADEIITGQLRAVIATMTIEQINSDRDAFMESIQKNVDTELNKIGLEIVNVNITDINDESGYIQALGKKAAEEAVQKALIDVAEQQKSGDIGVQTANKEKSIAVASQLAQAETGQKEAEARKRREVAALEAEAVTGENESKKKVATANAELAEIQAQAREREDVATANAATKILEAQKRTEQAKMEKEAIVLEEIEKKKVLIKAEAEAKAIETVALAKANAVKLEKEAEAEGIQKVLEAKAKGFDELFKTVGEEQKYLIPTMEVVKEMPSLVKAQADIMKNIKFEKIIVHDGGNGNGLAGFTNSLGKAMPQLHDLLKSAGIEAPAVLGKLVETGKPEKPAVQ